MLRVEDLYCERDRRQLFSALSFAVQPGQVLQVVGSNGSGKTTLLKILVGLYSDFEGEVAWSLDRPPVYLGHRLGVNQQLTVLENLAWYCQLQDSAFSESQLLGVLRQLELNGFEDSMCGNLSEGQLKRVALARFLVSENGFWVMDEPFSSIDAAGIEVLERCIEKQVAAGGSVVLTSHQANLSNEHLVTLELTS